jgi:hypothetical protein
VISLYKDPPAGTRNPSPAERLAVTYNGYTINNPADPADDQVELVEVAVTPITDQVIENKQGRDGMEVYQAFKSGLMIRLRGWIKKPTIAELMDEAALMAEKFDAALLSRRFQTSTIGFQALAFSVPTADLVGYPSGLVPSFYLARTMEPITFGRTRYDGHSMPFRIEMLARDPSRFFATQQVRLLTGASQEADNTLGRYPSWPTLTFTSDGTSLDGFTITNQDAFGGPKSLVLNLADLSNGQQVRVDFEKRRIFVNGVLHMELYASGDYFQIEPRMSSTIDISSASGLTLRQLTWYRAFPT